ncbi:MAG: VanZ family protein [Gammaproteobacteria bacterium]
MNFAVASTYRLRWATWWWLGGLGLIALVLGLSLMPSPPAMTGSDKLGHVSAYATLAFWFSGLYPRKRFWLILLALFAFGVMIEVLQGLGGHRHAEYYDALANLAGIAIGLLLGSVFTDGWCARIEDMFNFTSGQDR